MSNIHSIPINTLRKVIGQYIVIRLKDNVKYKGKLQSFDQYMNCHLNDAIEIIDDEEVSKYGNIFVRGNNILLVQLSADDI
ncbi:MAG: LSM domain-containing protein [Candidatus Heimdallarchaeaceae archaeon]|nr:ribonucleoprotein [Candidatus Heimdallarchaeota archaeon]MCK5305467.1 ribonucleoprotein [Candidatus Heimdallarchaeota archaeon]